MRKILILFAHPRYEHSVVNRQLAISVSQSQGVTFHDLYELYPGFDIDIQREQELLTENDIIIWHHPFYWYSCPPLLKQWIDLVLEFNWAYGPHGNVLKGKYIFNVVTTGGTREAYQTGGRNRFTLNQLLAPFDQTAWLCKMIYLPPYSVQGTHRLDADNLKKASTGYKKLLQYLSDETFNPEELQKFELLNDFLNEK